jgi:bacterioferritin-associated ferredoxin
VCVYVCVCSQVRQAEKRVALSEGERSNQERMERAARLDEVGVCGGGGRGGHVMACQTRRGTFPA